MEAPASGNENDLPSGRSWQHAREVERASGNYEEAGLRRHRGTSLAPGATLHKRRSIAPVDRLPDRADAIRAINDLLRGRRTRTEVARWAQLALYRDGADDDTPFVDHALADALTLLSTADWQSEGRPQLGESDFGIVLDRLRHDPLHRRRDDRPLRFAARQEVEQLLVDAVAGRVSPEAAARWAEQALEGESEALASGAWERDDVAHRALAGVAAGEDAVALLDELRAATAAEIDDADLEGRAPDRDGVLDTLRELLEGRRSRAAVAVWARRALDVWSRVADDSEARITFDQPAVDTLTLLLNAAVTWHGRPYLHDLPTFAGALAVLESAPPPSGPARPVSLPRRVDPTGEPGGLGDLDEAREDSLGVVVLEGDWGGQVFATCPARLVVADTEVLERLVLDLDSVLWGQADGAAVRFERHPVGERIAAGMGGAEVVDGVWVHPEVHARGLAQAVEDVLLGRRGPLTMDELAKAMPGR